MEDADQSGHSGHQFNRRAFGIATGVIIAGSTLTGCGNEDEGYYANSYLDWIRRNSEAIPKQTYERRSLTEWAADAKAADDATRPYARRLYEQIDSRYDGRLSVDRAEQMGQKNVYVGTGEGRNVERFIEWNAGRLKIGAQTTVETSGNKPNRIMVSMTYLVPPFSSSRLSMRDALYGNAKLEDISYLNQSKQGGVLIGRKSLNGDVELVTPKGVDETVIDVSRATRIALDETRAAAARLGLA